MTQLALNNNHSLWEVDKLSKLTKQNVIWRLKHASVALSRGLLHICCLHVQISAVSFSEVLPTRFIICKLVLVVNNAKK
jgi:hypothetical protein